MQREEIHHDLKVRIANYLEYVHQQESSLHKT